MADRTPGTVLAVAGGVLVVMSSFWVLFSAIFLLVGAIFALVFPLVFGLPFRDLQLDREAWTAPGTIVAVEPTPEMEVMSEPTVRLRYRFYDGDTEVDGAIQVRESNPLSELAVDDAVTVEYLSGTPGVNRLAGGRYKVAGWGGAAGLGFGALGLVMTALSLIPAVIGLILVWWGVRRRARAEREEAAAG